MVFEGLDFGNGTSSPTDVLKDLITADDEINLKTRLTIKGIKALIHLEVLNRIRKNKDPEKDAYDILLDVLHDRYKPYMASLDGWRSGQVVDGVKQFVQQINPIGQTLSQSIGEKK